MAALTTSQRAPLIITTENGTVVPTGEHQLSFDPTGIVGITNEGGAEGTNYVVANVPGTTTLTATYQGQVGTLEITVTAAPLTVELGEPEPK
jgi:hypothetical protein